MVADPELLEGTVLEGRLEHDGAQVPVKLRFASRLSLFVSFPDTPPPADRTVFPRLQVTLGERAVELSSCRLHVEYTRQGYAGRLAFLDDVYDCQALVTQGKFVNLKGFFQNLPLVLAQKDGIEPAFKELVSRSLYDLAVYKRFFDEQDRILANEPAPVADPAQAALLRTEGKVFHQFFDAQLAELGLAVKGFDKAAHERHGFYLRRKAWHFILGSEFLKRTNLKPRGYAGDAEMMQMLYENRYVGRYVFNKLMHKHPIETPAAQAVRNRRRLVPRVLREVASRFSGPVRFFSVASGPAWELQDIYLDTPDAERFQAALLDQDPEALSSAKQGVARIESARDLKLRVEYFNDSVRTMLRSATLDELFGRFHFIYSMGLFDYLTPPTARAIMAKLYGLLLPGGSMVVGNYHVGNPTRTYMEYWMDWVLYYRTESEFLELAADLPGAKASVSFDESGAQMFLQVDKVG
ncbi:MAG: class I SAM-dependent methyltransferase [Myxococcaceae bacterium]